MYVRTMKKHRSLPRSLRQLRVAQELLGDAFKLFLVSHEGRDVAGGVYHVFGDTVELVYNGSEESALVDAAQPLPLLGGDAVGRGTRPAAIEPRRRRRRTLRWRASRSSGEPSRAPATGSIHRAGGKQTRTEALASIGLRRRGLGEPAHGLRLAARAASLLRLGAHVAYRYA